MTPLLWTLALACLMPYVPHLAVMWARYSIPTGYSYVDPRADNDKLAPFGRRAVAAEQNAFEALPPFLFGGLLCAFLHADPTLSMGLAAIWIVARLAYAAIYLWGLGPTRTAVWAIGQACTAGLIGVAAVTGHAA